MTSKIIILSNKVHLSLIQEQAIAARTALIVGAKEFDRLFPGVQFPAFQSVCQPKAPDMK